MSTPFRKKVFQKISKKLLTNPFPRAIIITERKEREVTIMWEYGIRNNATGEQDIIFGYGETDAFARNPELNPVEWTITYSTYID